jgi:hypothetical protein
MKRLILPRLQKLSDRTLGRLLVFDNLNVVGNFCTLELPWRNNKKNESCILSGYYTVVPRTSEKFGKHLLVENVLNRDLVLFHFGNDPTDTEGCIITGTGFANIDTTPEFEVIDSKNAMAKLARLITERAELIIL